MEQVNLDDDNPTSHSEGQEHLYHNYQELLRWIPSLKSDLAAESEDYEVRLIMKNLNKGADGACGDDAARLKIAIVGWLMSSQLTPEPALEPWHKTGCHAHASILAHPPLSAVLPCSAPPLSARSSAHMAHPHPILCQTLSAFGSLSFWVNGPV
ncbi:hypothetical protein EDD16DRAFT_1709283 [Pisolithus croceorrhizus]|nr:hypothetical protein EDD16DRAFT_1709283 [Pisolithus croceorrhizus]